jgi:hypothetical protein
MGRGSRTDTGGLNGYTGLTTGIIIGLLWGVLEGVFFGLFWGIVGGLLRSSGLQSSLDYLPVVVLRLGIIAYELRFVR